MGHCWRNKNELRSNILRQIPQMDKQESDGQLERIKNRFVWTLDAV